MVLERELAVAGLLALVWAFEKVAERGLRTSPVLGQLVAGILVGPPLANLVPNVDALRLLGKVGVMALVCEGGMSVDLKAVRSIAPLAVAAAATGVLFPVLLSMLVLSAALGEPLNTGLAAGAALAPTSLGFSAKLLSEVGRLDTDEGVLICCAAVIDDVIALVLLSEIQALSDSDAGAWPIARPLVGSLASIVVGLGLTLMLAPRIDGWFARRVRDARTRGEVKLGVVLGLAVLFAYLSALAGSSDLLGCFFAGLVFSGNIETTEAWTIQVKRLQRWGAALFFAATIGFGVPRLLGSGGLLSLEAFWRGLLLTLAAVLGKLVLGVWARPRTKVAALTFGFAMMGRGEFSFLIADQALSDGLLSETNHSAVTWALLLASATSPIFFRKMLTLAPPDPAHPAAEAAAAAAAAAPGSVEAARDAPGMSKILAKEDDGSGNGTGGTRLGDKQQTGEGMELRALAGGGGESAV